MIGVAGSHLAGHMVSSSCSLLTGQVTLKTLSDLKGSAEINASLPGREILHSTPVAYNIDNREAIDKPVGLCGESIKARYFIIDSDQLYLKDIINAANKSGLEVSKLYAEPFASSCVSVPEEAKSLGVAIADIGGGTTDGISFIEGMPKSCFTFSIGGLMMTNDLAIGLNIPNHEAEKVKNYFGISALRTHLSIDVKDVHGRPKKIQGIEAQKILSYRILEWASQLEEKLRPFRGQLGSGIILSGGGSLVLSIADMLEKLFHLPVKTCYPSFDLDHKSSTYAASYATVLGLLQLYHRESSHTESHSNLVRPRFLTNLTSWIRDFS